MQEANEVVEEAAAHRKQLIRRANKLTLQALDVNNYIGLQQRQELQHQRNELLTELEFPTCGECDWLHPEDEICPLSLEQIDNESSTLF